MEKETIYFEITNFQQHSIRQRNPKSLADKLLKSIRSQKEVRWHGTDEQSPASTQANINLGMSLLEVKKILEERTGKNVEFMIAKNGPPIVPSNDSIEKALSIKKKRKYDTRVWRNET